MDWLNWVKPKPIKRKEDLMLNQLYKYWNLQLRQDSLWLKINLQLSKKKLKLRTKMQNSWKATEIIRLEWNIKKACKNWPRWQDGSLWEIGWEHP
jgi:hypothetical protein